MTVELDGVVVGRVIVVSNVNECPIIVVVLLESETDRPIIPVFREIDAVEEILDFVVAIVVIIAM
ncbi:MAG: hypothetical protein LCH93_04965, partial [Proteobacteria bacterium]|nr:hypothetical protein [Pseudomonadota bacterium]